MLNSYFALTITTKLSGDQITQDESVTVTYSLMNISKQISADFSPLQKNFHIIYSNYGNNYFHDKWLYHQCIQLRLAFKLALKELEQALYSKQALRWDGTLLLQAFLHFKKMKKNFSQIEHPDQKNMPNKINPLPSLNPP